MGNVFLISLVFLGIPPPEQSFAFNIQPFFLKCHISHIASIVLTDPFLVGATLVRVGGEGSLAGAVDLMEAAGADPCPQPTIAFTFL